MQCGASGKGTGVKLTRNERIALEVINGETLQSVGDRYKITRERVKQLTVIICKRYARIVYAKTGPSIKEMRKYKRRLSNQITSRILGLDGGKRYAVK